MVKYVFDHWLVGTTTITENPATIGPITADMTIVAVYVEVPPRNVTLNSSPIKVAYVTPAGTAPFTVQVEDGGNITVQVPDEVSA